MSFPTIRQTKQRGKGAAASESKTVKRLTVLRALPTRGGWVVLEGPTPCAPHPGSAGRRLMGGAGGIWITGSAGV
ncbi:hypothetical protein BHM03_00045385 [Ensete ventricosum]|nr:hypothetical protein BHM03_00045385 [Ensete ventricosum]